MVEAHASYIWHGVERWTDTLADLHGRIARRFARAEVRERARRYLVGLLERVERTYARQLAEAVGKAGPRPNGRRVPRLRDPARPAPLERASAGAPGAGPGSGVRDRLIPHDAASLATPDQECSRARLGQFRDELFVPPGPRAPPSGAGPGGTVARGPAPCALRAEIPCGDG